MSLVTIGNIPVSFTWEQQQFLQTLVDAVKRLQPVVVPPAAPTNLRVIPQGGGNIVQFTRSDGDGYVLYRNTVPSLNGARRIDLGRSNQYVDDVGAGAVEVFYWIAAKLGQLSSIIVGPVSGTTLALGTGITPPPLVPSSQYPATSDLDNQ